MAVRAENISKAYLRKAGGANHFYAVKNLNLVLPDGAVTVLVGRSGSGKTTLLNLFGGLLTPTEGRIYVTPDIDLYSMKDAALARFRNEHLGVIPQGRAVLDTLNVLENILLPAALYGGGTSGESARLKEKALRLLERLGIGQLEKAMPRELSGGELRRVSIARTLLREPKVILADEPTGDLDDENTKLVLELLCAEAKKGAAVLLVTHETDAIGYADAAYRMDHGEIAAL